MLAVKQQQRRAIAAQAAAQAFTVWPDHSMEALWALCVFFELYVRDGGDATQAEFGRSPARPAAILKMIRPMPSSGDE